MYGRYYNRRGYNYGYRGSRFGRRFGTVSGVSRSDIPTKITRKEVSKIAKRVVRKDDEVKMFDNSYGSSMTQGAWYVTNLFNGLTQNVSSEGHVGRKINLQALRFRVRMAVDASNPSGAVWRFMVFKTSQQLTASTSAAVVQGDIFRTNPTSFDITAMPDPQSMTVLMDFTGVVNPQTENASNGDVAFKEFYIPHRRVLEFLGENDSYLKQDNYYVYFGMARDNGLTSTAGYAQFSWQLQYTDA